MIAWEAAARHRLLQHGIIRRPETRDLQTGVTFLRLTIVRGRSSTVATRDRPCKIRNHKGGGKPPAFQQEETP